MTAAPSVAAGLQSVDGLDAISWPFPAVRVRSPDVSFAYHDNALEAALTSIFYVGQREQVRV